MANPPGGVDRKSAIQRPYVESNSNRETFEKTVLLSDAFFAELPELLSLGNLEETRDFEWFDSSENIPLSSEWSGTLSENHLVSSDGQVVGSLMQAKEANPEAEAGWNPQFFWEGKVVTEALRRIFALEWKI